MFATVVGRGRVLLLLVLAACPPQAPRDPKHKVTLFVFPAESADFPKTAKAATDAMSSAKVVGVEQTTVAKTSLGDAQLLIECNEPTPDCYQAVGKSLSADRLLFTVIATQPNKKVKISVTEFDVGARRAWSHAEKVFATDAEASAAMAGLVGEAAK
jgi:hypothetical protein